MTNQIQRSVFTIQMNCILYIWAYLVWWCNTLVYLCVTSPFLLITYLNHLGTKDAKLLEFRKCICPFFQSPWLPLSDFSLHDAPDISDKRLISTASRPTCNHFAVACTKWGVTSSCSNIHQLTRKKDVAWMEASKILISTSVRPRFFAILVEIYS